MIFRSLFLTTYATVALLGSAGTHEVSEWLGACSYEHHHHGEHHNCSHGHHHAHEHHHAHKHATHRGHASSDHNEQPAEPVQFPTHDSDNCLVCHHFSLSVKSTSFVTLADAGAAIDRAPLPAYEGAITCIETAFYRRGPPCAG